MNIQWLKFGILIVISLLNMSLGLLIFKKNSAKQKCLNYFGLICMSTGIWAISIGSSLLIKNVGVYKLLVKLFYISATCIFIFFALFAEEFIYKIYKKNIYRYLILIIFSIFLIFIVSNQFCIDTYTDKYGLHEVENKKIHLFYGIYIIMVSLYSYYILFKKFIASNGINKNILKFIILGTLVPFVIGIYFDWYFPQIGKHYLDWIGPIFTAIMNLSIAYLLFKHD
ncbi:MAG: histidine kinase N-terminal 7TM domain-containing protein [Patescibacteria group bacterium]|nr:histidine kinase N-terminal 7TM domain-containing protein [Patescibacteria group bacterium]